MFRRQHDDGPRRWLRRRLLGGYDPHDVELVLASLNEQLDHMAESLDRVWRDRERLSAELTDARGEFDVELARERARGDETEAKARAKAAQLLAAAEEAATRLRHDAGMRVRDAAQRLEDLLRVREQLLGELRGIVDAYDSLLRDIEQERAPLAPAFAGDGAPQRAAAPAALFPRRVELDAGPFADFAELAAFERSLTRLPKVEDVHIRRFGEERADIELTLTDETPLVHDLLAHLPYAMEVRPEDEARLLVEVREAVSA